MRGAAYHHVLLAEGIALEELVILALEGVVRKGVVRSADLLCGASEAKRENSRAHPTDAMCAGCMLPCLCACGRPVGTSGYGACEFGHWLEGRRPESNHSALAQVRWTHVGGRERELLLPLAPRSRTPRAATCLKLLRRLLLVVRILVCSAWASVEPRGGKAAARGRTWVPSHRELAVRLGRRPLVGILSDAECRNGSLARRHGCGSPRWQSAECAGDCSSDDPDALMSCSSRCSSTCRGRAAMKWVRTVYTSYKFAGY